MSDARLPAGLEAAAIIRRSQTAGDFAAIVRRGDADGGAILLLITSRGRHVAVLERTMTMLGTYAWAQAGPPESAPADVVARFLADRTRFDPDIWAIELDIANPERFIAETTATG